MKRKWKITILIILILVVVLAIVGYEVYCDMKYYSEDEVIAIFNENQDKFFTAQEYIATEDPYANLYFIDGVINEDEQTLPDDVVYLMKKLDFVSVRTSDYERIIYFTIQGGPVTHGIMYIGSNDIPQSSAGAYYKKIMDHWFYFEMYYT